MDRNLAKERLLRLLAAEGNEWPPIDVTAIDDDTSLLNDLMLDSLQLLDLVVAMEREFGFRADTSQLNLDMFDRLSSVVDFVVDSVAASPAPPVEDRDAAHTS